MATDNHTVHRDPLHHEIKKKDNVMSDLEFACCRDLSDAFHGAGGVGGLLAVSVAGDYYFPFYDNNGNVMGYADENRSCVARYDYDAFGNLTSSSGPMADFFPHRFSTKYYDPDLGLYYYGYRWYSPELGRWISRDPIEEDGVALYAFVHNMPPSLFDPFGLKCSVASGPVVDKPHYWKIGHVKLDSTGNGIGLVEYDGLTVTWKLKGKVVCCCNGKNVTKQTEKRLERNIDLAAVGLVFVAHNPAAPATIEVPDLTSFLNALASAMSAVALKASNELAPWFFDENALSNIRAALKLSAPKSLSAGNWPDNPCD